MTDWEVAYVLWWCANRFGVCHSVSVTCSPPQAPTAPDPHPLTLFPDTE